MIGGGTGGRMEINLRGFTPHVLQQRDDILFCPSGLSASNHRHAPRRLGTAVKQFSTTTGQKPKGNRPADLLQDISTIVAEGEPQFIARQSNAACSIPPGQGNEQRENRRMKVHVLMAIDVRQFQTCFGKAGELCPRVPRPVDCGKREDRRNKPQAQPNRRIRKSPIFVGDLRQPPGAAEDTVPVDKDDVEPPDGQSRSLAGDLHGFGKCVAGNHEACRRQETPFRCASSTAALISLDRPKSSAVMIRFTGVILAERV